MIVVDTNVLAYLVLPGPEHEAAVETLARDGEWAVPILYRSEICNFLARRVRLGVTALPDALRLLAAARETIGGREYAVDPEAVLHAAATSGCTAYDCEFVVLARDLGVPLVTNDGQVLRAFPRDAVALRKFAR